MLGLGHSRLTCRRLLVYISSVESRAVLFAKNYFVFNSHFWFVYSITFINISGPWAESDIYDCTHTHTHTTHTHTHTFNTPFSRTTRVSRNQKGKTNLDFTEARDSKWQWHQLWNRSGFKWGKRWWGYWDGRGISWTICKQSAPCSRQITTPTPRHSIFTGRMFFLTTNQKANTYYSITSGN